MTSPCYCCQGQIVIVNINLHPDLSPLHSSSTPLWLSLLFPLLLIATGDTLLLRVNTDKVVVVHTGLCQIW